MNQIKSSGPETRPAGAPAPKEKAVRRFDYNAPVTLTFAAICCGALALNAFTGGWTAMKIFSVYRCSLKEPLAWFRFFGHAIGHANYEHLTNNLLLILVLGPGLEEKYGGRDLITAMLVTAFASGLIQFIFFPSSMLMGASGIVFMMIMLSSFGNMRTGTIPITTLLVFFIYVGREVWNAFTITDQVSQITHIVGGVIGTELGFLLHDRSRPADLP